MIRGIIFDLGHTLVDHEADYESIDAVSYKALVESLSCSGVRLSGNFIDDLKADRQKGILTSVDTEVEVTHFEILQQLLRKHGITADERCVRKAVDDYYAAELAYWDTYPEAESSIKSLSAVYKMAIFSNADDDTLVQNLVEKTGLRRFFSPVKSSAAPPQWRKPDPRVFTAIASSWGMPCSEIAVVGDLCAFDIVGAHRAGMTGILIERSAGSGTRFLSEDLYGSEQASPDAVIRSLAELPELLKILQPATIKHSLRDSG